MRVSNVDKHTREGEHPVRLCNYVDVYKNDRISSTMPFMQATATKEEIERFRLERGDVVITKDSETWDDIGVPAIVTEPSDDLISGYHLAILRPRPGIYGSYLFWALQSRPVACQFHIEAKGVTRYGLSHNEIQSVTLPVPPPDEQAAIVRFLDHTDEQIQRYITSKERLITLLQEERQAVSTEATKAPNIKNLRLEVVADLIRRPIQRSDVEIYTPIGLYNRGRGIFLKEPTSGIDLAGCGKTLLSTQGRKLSDDKRRPIACSERIIRIGLSHAECRRDS